VRSSRCRQKTSALRPGAGGLPRCRLWRGDGRVHFRLAKALKLIDIVVDGVPWSSRIHSHVDGDLARQSHPRRTAGGSLGRCCGPGRFKLPAFEFTLGRSRSFQVPAHGRGPRWPGPPRRAFCFRPARRPTARHRGRRKPIERFYRPWLLSVFFELAHGSSHPARSTGSAGKSADGDGGWHPPRRCWRRAVRLPAIEVKLSVRFSQVRQRRALQLTAELAIGADFAARRRASDSAGKKAA